MAKKCEHPEYELENEFGSILYCRVCGVPIAILEKPFNELPEESKVTYIHKDS